MLAGLRFSEEVSMQNQEKLNARLIGVELYFDDLQQGKHFYGNVLGLELLDQEAGHHARFNAGECFVCVERKGSEPYPSRDKAVVFLEVSHLADAVRCIGEEKIIASKPLSEGRRLPWAALHDPEGYNIVLVEAPRHPRGVEGAN
jgi:catechol 2,3-dioxygenase-like lactoylglutathione lyase family enzyme